jgi:starch phosphorylase
MAYKKVFPNHYHFPQRINRLGELAYNLWWAWNPSALRLFSELDRPLWDSLNHNPIAFLHQIDQKLLENAAKDSLYLDEYDSVMQQFETYMNTKDACVAGGPGCARESPTSLLNSECTKHAFLCMRLGILSEINDRASDMGIPLVGVGFIYHQGYFVQKLTEDGWQETSYFHFNFEEMPIIALTDADGKPLTISVQLPDRKVYARTWMIQVGRIPLYLLDSNVEKNSPHDRHLTARLYSNDLEIRISQEILLGCGGVRLLKKLGENLPYAHERRPIRFSDLERVHELMKIGLSFDEQQRMSKTMSSPPTRRAAEKINFRYG